MGKYSDRYGARAIASIGILFIIAGVSFYIFFLGAGSPVYYVVIGIIVTGFGGAMFWPANSSAVRANVRDELRGAASGMLRLFGSMGLHRQLCHSVCFCSHGNATLPCLRDILRARLKS